ncbi:transcriptional regulator [Leptospira sp. FAT2]|uniref:transcriptional regulator n=1 Tax=Leptospira sanjuanensis TaxID=2879643 RepID=UPI001EE875D8|nr:transcriptional regulator [Leptospira sanjuanensis]MCG6192205.1 transcriptional regulator [Leptospira sanjuanensis]
MNQQKERLKIIISKFKGNQREFGFTIGKSKQTISGWLSGRFPVPEDAAITIEMVHGYRREWILRGEMPSKVSHKGLQAKIASIDTEVALLRKIASNRKLQDIIEILTTLSKRELEIAYRLIESLTDKDTKTNSLS